MSTILVDRKGQHAWYVVGPISHKGRKVWVVLDEDGRVCDYARTKGEAFLLAEDIARADDEAVSN